MPYLLLDTETTGQDPHTCEVVSIAIISSEGKTLLYSLVRPVVAEQWPEAEKIHGISPDMVKDAPTLAELNQLIAYLLRGQNLVIYNAAYDSTVLRQAFRIGPPARVACAMLAFAKHIGEPSRHKAGEYKWHNLTKAAEYVKHEWTGAAHGAEADCFATLSVYEFLKREAAKATERPPLKPA